MNEQKTKLMKQLAKAVVEMDEGLAESLTRSAIELGMEAYEVVQKGLAVGMNIVGEKYEKEEYYVPQLLLCSDAMYAGLNVLKPALKRAENKNSARIVIGVVEGDTHDIGKSLVQMMMEASGFEVFDLGKNVAIDRFIEAAEEHSASFICMSTLMSTTMEGMAELIRRLNSRGLRDKYKVVIGGGPVTQEFCNKIGADGYSPDAAKAVRLIKNLN